MVVAIGAALASSLNVPFYNDTDTAGAGEVRNGTRNFVGLHNNETFDIVLTFNYFNDAGERLVPFDQTGLLPALSSLSMRPGNGTSFAESDDAAALPNRGSQIATALNDPTPNGLDTNQNGSIVVEWTDGTALSVQGRLFASSQTASTSAYLLPPGQ